ncbi:hypothetical protein HTZ77_38030 [Nonomuraea sp. SMC257]|uniref:Uncharacterized protein n=1 Tax=Nonomuraea montanisoli TaxID=2741721 RepID=A0A7Y6IFB6_9ACTN|nr:hypothetical protein [Nonomuraea montanisoli]NUW37162.1 hypothetical protein [Nonomuraea montanisoli]
MKAIVLLGLTFAFWFCLPGIASGAGKIRLVVAPAKLSLVAGETATVDVLARLPDDMTIADVTLTTVPRPDLKVTPPDPRPIAPSSGWRVSVTMISDQLTSGELVLVARAKKVSGLTLAHLPVEVRRGSGHSELLKMTVTSAHPDLAERRPVLTNVTVQNVGTVAVQLREVWVRLPPGLRGCVEERCAPGEISRRVVPESLEPGAVAIYDFLVEATKQARTGRQLMLYGVTGDYAENGRLRPVAVVASQEVTYAVLGESEFLTAIGIPSFLVLPGFLALMSYRLVARRYNAADEVLPSLEVSAPEFLTLSATLSVLAIPMFWLVTWLLGDPHTYLTGYGVDDLLAVWLASVLIGLCAFGIPRFVLVWREHRRTPRPSDRPQQFLERLSAAGASVMLPQVRVELRSGAPPKQLYTFTPGTRQDGSVWVVPAIRYSFEQEAADADVERLREVLDGTASAAAVLKAVRQTSTVRLAWAPGPVCGPKLVGPSKIVDEVQPACLLRQSTSSGWK